MTATQLLVWGGLIHLVVDWLLQNDWMAQNKGIAWTPGESLRAAPKPWRHPGGPVHATLHALGLWIVFPWWVALAIGLIHYLVDLRVPLAWWRHAFGQDTGPVVTHVSIWEDQVVHLLIIGGFALGLGRGL